MSRIGLVAVDSANFPNLPLMKLSAYHKQRGDSVEWAVGLEHYDVVYMSTCLPAGRKCSLSHRMTT
jgi:hypothetical protein